MFWLFRLYIDFFGWQTGCKPNSWAYNPLTSTSNILRAILCILLLVQNAVGKNNDNWQWTHHPHCWWAQIQRTSITARALAFSKKEAGGHNEGSLIGTMLSRVCIWTVQHKRTCAIDVSHKSRWLETLEKEADQLLHKSLPQQTDPQVRPPWSITFLPRQSQPPCTFMLRMFYLALQGRTSPVGSCFSYSGALLHLGGRH